MTDKSKNNLIVSPKTGVIPLFASQKFHQTEIAFSDLIRQTSGLIAGVYYLEDVREASPEKCRRKGCTNKPEVMIARIVSARNRDRLEIGLAQLKPAIRDLLMSTNGRVAICLDCQMGQMLDGKNIVGIKTIGPRSLSKSIWRTY